MKYPRNRILLASSVLCAATILALACAATAIEFWVRFTWDPLKGSPGLYESSPTRIEQFAPDYSGYYTGVPLQINNLGFRDNRDYEVEKRPSTVRIAVLGDSVTFGHGSLYESTYPYLLEQKLTNWRPAIDWQVWNLGVPGYNTSHILAYLGEMEPLFKPDLVIIGFYENDLYGNETIRTTKLKRMVSRVKNFVRRHLYSFHFYKKAYLQFYAVLFKSEEHAYRLTSLAREQRLLSHLEKIQNLEEQAVTSFLPTLDHADRDCTCDTQSVPPLSLEDPSGQAWWQAVNGIKSFDTERICEVLFFINIAPDTCPPVDRFCHGAHYELNKWLVDTLHTQLPVVSSYDAFYQQVPSEMPLAGGHSLGNSNEVKAETLFRYLKADEHIIRLAKERLGKK